MNEKEESAFRTAWRFLSKWRETVIETDEQWQEFAKDVGGILEGDPENGLLWKLMTAVMDHFTDLYKDGMKPMPAGYLGRDDL